MRTLTIFLAITRFAFGIAASWFWLKTSKISVVAAWGDREPLDPSQSNAGWLAGLIQANAESGRLNRIAAQLTAVAVAFSTANALAGLYQ